jgi:hypothetical protein
MEGARFMLHMQHACSMPGVKEWVVCNASKDAGNDCHCWHGTLRRVVNLLLPAHVGAVHADHAGRLFIASCHGR